MEKRMQDNTQLLTGKTVLITGAAKRIGAAMARGFHAAGANLVVHYRSSAAEAEALVSGLQDLRANSAVAVQADLIKTGRIAKLVDRAVEEFGRLDVLVNNASSFYATEFGSISEGDWHDLVGSNLKAPLFLSQAAREELAKASGCIINMVDIHAQRPLQDHSVYCAAKAGLGMLTLSLARELGPEIRVNGIAPGAILWPEEGTDQAQQDAIVRRTPLQRSGSPEDIVRTALFLAAHAPFISGQIIAVDGGRSAGW